MHKRLGKKIAAGFALAVLAPLLATGPAPARPAPAAPMAGPAMAASAPVPTAAPDPEISLCASTGSVTMPDSVAVDIWGYSLDTGTGCGPAQLPGPQIDVTAGDQVTVHLTNVDVPANVSLVIPGTTLMPDTTGVAAGSTKTYTFTASQPGSYLYQSAAGNQRGVLMGLYGALVVHPATPGQAYDTPASAFDTEATLVLGELDPGFNADPASFDLTDYHPRYWLISGQAYPDTATISAAAGQRTLLRILNAGSLHHTMTLLGAHQRVIAKDGYPVPFPYDVVAETVPAGTTLDTIVTIPASAAVGTQFPIYSRQLNLTNDGSFPGGMLTFLEVGAPAVNQPPNVDSGPDMTLVQLSASLNGTVSDDGLTEPVTTQWSKVSGPGTVTFGDPSALNTTATFSSAGAYILRLTADDGELTAFDDVAVTVDRRLHVGDLDGTSFNLSSTRWRARVRVSVHNAIEGSAANAKVTGSWSAGDTTGRTLSCTTLSDGTCFVTSGRISRALRASVTFTVTNVTKSGFGYQQSANHDPDGDSNGTAITVLRP